MIPIIGAPKINEGIVTLVIECPCGGPAFLWIGTPGQGVVRVCPSCKKMAFTMNECPTLHPVTGEVQWPLRYRQVEPQ